MELIDTVVVGGGVVGLAAGLAVAQHGRSVCVLEREPRPGMGTSTHNSQVIHAGIYYPAGSLKARHCVEGSRMLYDFCARYGVPHRRSGKLIVTDVGGSTAELERLLALGMANGVPGLTVVDAAFVKTREPHVRAGAALFSPSTGIVDAEALVRTLARLCVQHDAVLLPGSPLVAADPNRDGFELHTPSERIAARSGVNAAGLYADDVSRLLGGSTFTIHPCRGEYAELIPSRRQLVDALVYPVPHPHGHSLGVHLTRTLQGNVTLGPTVRFQDRRNDYEDNRLPVETFLEPAQRLLPSLQLHDLRLGGSGIRPKLHGPDVAFKDFLIGIDDVQPRLIQAAGIESPGLTACLSIGQHVAALVEDVLR